MNVIYFDMCATMIIFVTMFSVFFKKMTHGRTNRYFIFACTFIFLACLGDLFAEYPTRHPSPNLTWLVYFADTLYFTSISLALLYFLLFVLTLCKKTYLIKEDKVFACLIYAPTALTCVLLTINFFTPIIFKITGTAYEHGYGFMIFYFLYTLNATTGFVLVLRSKKMFSKDQFWSLLVLYIMNYAALIVQYFFPNYYIQMFAMSLGIMIIPITINKLEYINPVVGGKNYKCFVKDIRLSYTSKRKQDILFMRLNNAEPIKVNLGLKGYDNMCRYIMDNVNRFSEKYNVDFDAYLLNSNMLAIIFQKDMNLEQILSTCAKINLYITEMMSHYEHEIALESSIILVDKSCKIPHMELLLDFDRVMSECISSTNNKLIFFRDIMYTRDFQIRYHLDEIISRALKDGNFFMVYQPIYSLKEKRFNSAEALIRLKDEKYGFIPPSVFIPHAEATGAIHKIGAFVIEEVLKFAASENFKKLNVDYIELNLSTVQLVDPNLAKTILNLFKKYNLPKQRINFEITESFDEVEEEIDRNLKILNEAGISFSLDDYGTGYSNMRRIVHMPLEIIKIDRIFVLEKDKPEVYAILKNTISIIKELGKHIVIEGVETEEEKDFFERLGVDYVQGYYYSKPLEIPELLEKLKANV